MFDMLVVIREYPKRWVGFRLNVEFFSNGAISMTGTDWTKNNQYSFTVYKPTSIRIILRNKGRNNDKSKDSDYVFGYLLFTSKEG